jgi:hypothetical protein
MNNVIISESDYLKQENDRLKIKVKELAALSNDLSNNLGRLKYSYESELNSIRRQQDVMISEYTNEIKKLVKKHEKHLKQCTKKVTIIDQIKALLTGKEDDDA